MQYFTKELWLEAQNPDLRDANGKAWAAAAESYSKQLESLRDRVDQAAFSFFQEADIHDGHLVSIQIFDGKQVTWNNELPSFNFNPVSVTLIIQNHHRTLQWSLRYTGVRRTLVDFPSGQPTFYSEGEGFNDIGYDELTEANHEFLRHEILFSSGACILLEFQSISVLAQAV